MTTLTFGSITLLSRDGEPVVAHEPYGSPEGNYSAMLAYLAVVAPKAVIQTIDTDDGVTYVIYPSREAADAANQIGEVA